MRCVNGTGHVFKMKEKGRRNPCRVRITVGWNRGEWVLRLDLQVSVYQFQRQREL